MAHVLLVDDHPDLSEVVAELLKAHGHTVECCHNAETALIRLRDESDASPDAVVADQRLPGMTGVQLIRQIRLDPTKASIRAILCSADDSVAEEARAVGAQDFWLKGSDRLFERVAELGASLDHR